MGELHPELVAVLDRVRRRWRASVALHAWTIGAGVSALLLAVALGIDRFLHPGAPARIALWSITLAGAVAVIGWMLAPLRNRPAAYQVARYIEERCPELEDSLATAVAESQRQHDSPVAAAVAADALQRVRPLEVNRLISDDVLRTAAALAVAATVVLAAMVVVAHRPLFSAAQALTAYAFPQQLQLQVAPGDVKLRAGSSLRILAQLSGAADVVVPILRVQDDRGPREVRMEREGDRFVASFDDLQSGFRYGVAAGAAASAEYRVVVLHPPHVERIDVRYEYPSGFGMEPRLEEDGGDIYGPAGTRVHLTIRTDKSVNSGIVTLDDGRTLKLTSDDDGELLTGGLTITADGSYRVALTDHDGLANPGDTEYFIRTLQDSPPDVHIVRPAGDRPVTPLEEVPIEAKADDDFGIAAFDLVFSVRGSEERAVPFRRSQSGQTVAGHSIIYLEDLNVRPGDFVTFYARARDISRGKRSSEAKSDMFFLEVKPFEEEFVASRSGGGGAGSQQGADGSLEALVAAQKDVITATWRLDRRHRDAGTLSADDIRAVARAQAEVRSRVTGASAQNLRADDVRRRLSGQPARPASDPADPPLAKASAAMEQARTQLEALSTDRALPHEMTALNELLKAQAEIRRREVQRQEANNSSGGGGSNRQGQDLSSLFDRELARQQTNYETPTTAETREQKSPADDALEKIRELARRQEALNREQENLARNRERLTEDELRRHLERLTRDQSDLRQQAEDVSRQLQRSEGSQQAGRGRTGEQGTESRAQRGEAGQALQQASEEMKSAASGLRRQDPSQASTSGQRALDRLREGEKKAAQTGSQNGGQAAGGFDDRRRQIGELQLESRQLADAQRSLGRDRQQPSGNDADEARLRAGEQERLADRMHRLEESVKQLAAARSGGRDAPADGRQQQTALAEAARDLAAQRLAERMKNAARAASPRRDGDGEAQEIARALDRLADRLGAAAGESGADRRSAEQMARARDLREQLESVDRELSELQRRGESPGTQEGNQQPGRAGQSPGRSGQASASTGAWERARELLEELRQQESGLGTRDLAGFNPGLSAPGTEAFKQDFAKWEQLKTQLTAALEKLETTAAARLRAQNAKDRLNAGGSQAVPERYRGLVDKYYRALATPASAGNRDARAK